MSLAQAGLIFLWGPQVLGADGHASGSGAVQGNLSGVWAGESHAAGSASVVGAFGAFSGGNGLSEGAATLLGESVNFFVGQVFSQGLGVATGFSNQIVRSQWSALGEAFVHAEGLARQIIPSVGFSQGVGTAVGIGQDADPRLERIRRYFSIFQEETCSEAAAATLTHAAVCCST